jgi:hypothetical protein
MVLPRKRLREERKVTPAEDGGASALSSPADAATLDASYAKGAFRKPV